MTSILHKIDYVMVPVIVVVLFLCGRHNLIETLIGVMVWTFIEYWMHRILHTPGRLWSFHVQHHVAPATAVDGQQYTWIAMTMTAIVAVLVPALAPFIEGLMLGYLWFLALHWAMHHDKVRSGEGYLGTLLARHEAHHTVEHSEYWFGVTTSAWDFVFGTAA